MDNVSIIDFQESLEGRKNNKRLSTVENECILLVLLGMSYDNLRQPSQTFFESVL